MGEGVRVENGRKRVRVVLGGEVVADTLSPKLVWEHRWYPAYYFPETDVRMELLSPASAPKPAPGPGEATCLDVKGGHRVAEAAAWHHSGAGQELSGLVRLDWEAMDHWFEEDEEVYVHPRDPYSRVDILASSRHVQVVLGGVTEADTRQPRLLFETGLPTRYYVPLTEVRLDLLRPSDTMTHCPYKGRATYWSVEVDGQVFPDAAWTYKTPLPESQKIAGLVCFWNERSEIIVDGVLQERPQTKFS
jgi:uncharacterized protein (DUF427 family)